MGARWLRVLGVVGCLVVGVLVFMQSTGQGLRLGRSNATTQAVEVHESCRQAAIALDLDVKRQIDATLTPATTPAYMVICTVELTSGKVQRIGIPPVGAPVLLHAAP